MKKSKLHGLILSLLSRLKLSIQDYCELETVDGGTSIVAKDGSLVSIIRFNGTKSILGFSQFEELVSDISDSFSPFLRASGHQLQVLFYKDMDGRAPLEANAQRQKLSAAAIGLDVDDLIDENVDVYAKFIYEEECFLALWSRPSLLDPVETRREAENKNELRKETNFPALENAQNILRPISFLIDRHSSYVGKIIADLQNSPCGCSVELLGLDDALRAIRASVFKTMTHVTWSPAIPFIEKDGTSRPIPFRWKENPNKADASEFFYPMLSEQIMTSPAMIGTNKQDSSPIDATMVQLGDRYYAPMIFDCPPRQTKSFNVLFNALNNAGTKENGVNRALPFAISFFLEGDGMGGDQFKRAVSSVLSFASTNNKNITAAYKALSSYKTDDDVIVKFRITAMTWASATPDGATEVVLRKSKLIRILQGWGNPIISERIGDPMEGVQSCCLALAPKSIAPACPAPLYDALYGLPWTRPAPPFEIGSSVFRSLDGKIQWYQRFSPLQTTWVTIYVGKPGMGKSVLLNSNNFEACLLPDAKKLPWIMVIDIGISSAGFIDLIRDGLPEDKKHLAVYERLSNSAHKSINVMDSPLGLRKPLPSSFDFIKNFITTLVTPAERDTPLEGMSSFVGRVLTHAYAIKSDTADNRNPECYRRGHNDIIDNGVDQLRNFNLMEATTYWELVDTFFEAGMLYEAEVAQRYAVPVLTDLIQSANSQDISSEYSGSQGELIERFCIGIREAMNDYPMFSEPTRFDIGSARICALDLQDVAVLSSSKSAYKQTSLMYMIARQLFMRKIAYSKEDFPFISEKYMDHYKHLVFDIIDDPKILAMDEYHRTGKHAQLQNQVEADAREGRKWQLELVLASQLIEDFGSILKIATTVFVLDSGTNESRRLLREQVGITAEQEAALIKYVHGPTPVGTTCLAIFTTTNNRFAQLYTFTAGAIRLWSLSTTAEDRKLRELLYEKIPHKDARRLLANRFPSGSCKRVIAQMKAAKAEDTGTGYVDENEVNSMVENVANDLLKAYFADVTIATRK